MRRHASRQRLDEREAEALIGARDEGGAGIGHALKLAALVHAANDNSVQVPCVARMAREFSPIGLRVLREVAQAGSFSAAARSLGYTQSAVSRQVAALEAVAGRRLFERSRLGVVLTPAGARLLPARSGCWTSSSRPA